MSELPATPVTEMRQRLLEGMVSFMGGNDNEPDFDCNYTQADIDRCAAIVDADRKSTRLNSSHPSRSRMPSSA